MMGFYSLLLLQISTLFIWYVVWFFWNKLAYGIRSVLLILGLSILALCLVKAYRDIYPIVHIIIPVDIYLGPDTSYPMRGQLLAQQEVVVEQKKDGWYYVASAQGKGWIQGAKTSLGGN